MMKGRNVVEFDVAVDRDFPIWPVDNVLIH